MKKLVVKIGNIILVAYFNIDLPESLCDHELKGDWLLIYQKKNDVLVLELTRTGSHADLFGK